MARTDNCHACVYGWLEPCQLLAGFALGFPARPQCANQPGHYGRATPTPVGRVCPNYRPRPPEPKGEDVKRIILTNGMVAYVDAADYEELSRYTWCLVSGGYAGRRVGRVLIFMHRQIMNPPKSMQVDHIRGNRLDNTRAHLRVCTPAENAQNRAKRADNASRYLGVSYASTRRKWGAAIPLKSKGKHIGYYDDELEAARAYDHAAVLYLDDFARLNFPEEWPPERRAEVRAQRDAEAKEEVERQKEKVKDKGRGRTGGRARPRGTGHEPRATKRKPRAETRKRKIAKRTKKTSPHKTRTTRKPKRG